LPSSSLNRSCVGIQIQAGNHHLIHQFLSSSTNHRSDEYGGSLPNRLRLLLEIVHTIRSSRGTSFLISVNLSFHHPSIDHTPIPLSEYLEIIETLLRSQQVDLLEINIRQYPFYLNAKQLSSAFSGLPKVKTTGKTSQFSNDDKLDSHHLKKIYYLCQQQKSSCRLMLTARDGDSGTPDLYQTFFHQYCDILGYSDIFYSPTWITTSSSSRKKSSFSSPSMNGSYSRWYNIYVLGGRAPPDNSHSLSSLIITSIVNLLFQNQYCGYLFQRSYCHLLIEQLLLIDHNIQASKDHLNLNLYSTPLSLSKVLTLFIAVIGSTCWCPRSEKYSQSLLNIFILSFFLSSLLSLLFVAWVLYEVSS
jgi:hypothetical protein